VTLALAGELANQLPAFAGVLLNARTGREDDLVYALSLV
jgi:hypothetical protein